MRTQNSVQRLRRDLVGEHVERPVHEAPAGGWVADVPAETVHSRLAQARVLPASLAVACATHGVPVDVPCFGRTGERGSGICGDRLRRRSSVGAS